MAGCGVLGSTRAGNNSRDRSRGGLGRVNGATGRRRCEMVDVDQKADSKELDASGPSGSGGVKQGGSLWLPGTMEEWQSASSARSK